AVERMHHCSARLIQSVPIREWFEHETVWESAVHIFDLEGHPTASRAYAWLLPQSYPNYKSVHRRFQTWCRDEVLRRVLMDVANELRDKGALDEAECFIDATFVMAKGGGAGIGPT